MNLKMKNIILLFFLICYSHFSYCQNIIKGKVTHNGDPIVFSKVKIKSQKAFALTDDNGEFELNNLQAGIFVIEVFSLGFKPYLDTIKIPNKYLIIELEQSSQMIDEVVVSGTLKEISKKESTVNIEVYSTKFFKKNPSPSIYDAMQNINGVRPQLNCNICNTGDIHINGLEGPYTMILIDGMPIVSSLSTVYGLSGIPNSLVERIEIVKGPASTLYGSEAIGGVINIITKNPTNAPIFSFDSFTTSWLEHSFDLALKNKIGKNATVLTGVNYFNYSNPIDNNRDNFTDVTLQDRVSVFQKWNFKRKDYKLFSIAGRYLYEDRWGGEMNFTNAYRGGDSIYGESIYTSRWEVLGTYQLPVKENVFISTSINQHNQNSFYGDVSFQAQQFIAFGQIHWDKKIGKHNLLLGSAIRYTLYDDDTPATESNDSINPINTPSKVILPGVFIQDEIKFNKKNKLLLGLRYDHNSIHGSIFTPRIGYKVDVKKHSFRLNFGTGYRVVNIYTEDHAALTGAREVVISPNISPEKSLNGNFNYNHTFITKKRKLINIDASLFYTYFDNRIIADYETNPNYIFYNNLTSHAISQGLSVNLMLKLIRNLTFNGGFTLMDISTYENNIKTQQILTENFTATWSLSYEFPKSKFSIDYTGNLYSPMRLPLLNELDPRALYSPWWSIQNIQITYKKLKNWEFYGGVKNLLNWTPNKTTPFIIARSHDPFDKNVVFDQDGNAESNSENPYGLTFDPSYVYGPNQGIKGFLGARYTFNK